jgi:hypothetical protein
MASKSFSFSEVLGFGWRVMKSNFWFFVGVGVVLFLISLLGQILGQIMERYPGAIPPFWFFVLFAVTFIIEIILGIGLIKITLSFCDGLKPSFGTLFNGLDCFWRYLGTGLLYGLIIGGASIACVLPFALLSKVMRSPCFALPVFVAIFILAVILSIKFGLCFYFVVDKGLGPINALRASSRATKGAKWSLFVFGILCGLINLLGMLCFFVGLFATVPTIMVAAALVYRQLSEQTAGLAELGISGPGIEPSGGVTGGVQPVVPKGFGPAIQSGPGIRLGQPASQQGGGVQLSQGIRADSAKAALAATAGPASDIRREGEKTLLCEARYAGRRRESSNSLLWWVVISGVCVTIAAGISYYFLARAKGKVVVSPKEVVVSLKEVVVSPREVALKGILYSEGNSSALIGETIVAEGDIIDGVKVVKIHKDKVEFEKDGEKWTQRTK